MKCRFGSKSDEIDLVLPYRVRIHALDDCESLLTDAPHNADRSQQSRRMIYQEKEGDYGAEPKKTGNPNDDVRNSRIDPSDSSNSEE